MSSYRQATLLRGMVNRADQFRDAGCQILIVSDNCR